MKFEIFNRADAHINVLLEPIGDNFQIPPEMVGEIELHNETGVRIDVYEQNQLNIWTEGHVVVKIGNTTMEFTQMT